MSEETSLTWKCGCGKLRLKLSGEPWATPNCHCHSCVASSRFIDEKHSDMKDHTTAIVDGGVAIVFFMPDQVVPSTELSPELFGCVKVGPKGKANRLYAKCCGTQVGAVHPAFWALNRNAVYNEDGVTKYAPAEAPLNVMTRFAFDPKKVPDPSVSISTAGDIFKFAGVMLNPFGPCVDKEVLKKVAADTQTAEEVPITWE